MPNGNPWYTASVYGGGPLTRYDQGFTPGQIVVGGVAVPNPGYVPLPNTNKPAGNTLSENIGGETSIHTGSGGGGGGGGRGVELGQGYRQPTDSFTESESTQLPPAAPTNVSAHASSVSTGSGFGFAPDFSSLSPRQLQQLQAELSGVVYSPRLGGYITKAEANDPNSAFVKDYYGKPMTGGDAGANLAAKRAYSIIGSLPTVSRGSPALMQSGFRGSPGPSLTQRRGSGWLGPYSFPGYL